VVLQSAAERFEEFAKMDQGATDSVDLTKRLAGEVAIVTGGAGGIGGAVAMRLSREGAEVAILDVNEAGAHATAAALIAKGHRAIALACNVTKRNEVYTAVEAVMAHFGRLTVLVNNAGIVRRAPFMELTDETWDDVLGVNLKGAFIVAQEAARAMAKHRSGRIVNMASVAGEIAHSNQTAYSVSKAGVAAMTRTMAFELAPLGITVNAIAPGTIATSFAFGSLPESGRVSRLGRIPLGRFGSTAEVAAAVAFLASSDAAYVTGAVLRIDGGLVPGGVRDTPPS
jgi:NAD(P)-dependent dehydrogenase (short-subunit alcohol dehydrogenase family)